MSTATYETNARDRQDKMFQEMWAGRKPTVFHIQVFSCIAYTWILKNYRDKFDEMKISNIRCLQRVK